MVLVVCHVVEERRGFDEEERESVVDRGEFRGCNGQGEVVDSMDVPVVLRGL